MLNLQYPQGTYTIDNPPSNETLKADLQSIQTDVNAVESDVTSLESAVYTKTETDSAISVAISAVKQALFPVGSYYSNGAVTTNPATLLGFGTWVAIAGKGIMGYSVGETEFDTLLKTGGEKTHLLTGAESGEKGHNHTQDAHLHSIPLQVRDSNAGTAGAGSGGSAFNTGSTTATNQAVAASNASSAHNNLQPYEVAALWRRTA